MTDLTAPSSKAGAKHHVSAATAASDEENRTAIVAAVKAERASWSKVQQLVRQQPAIADTPIYQEIAQFQATVPTITDSSSTRASTKTVTAGGGDPLAGQTRKQRTLLLQNLTTQNVVLQTLIEQAMAAHLDGWAGVRPAFGTVGG